MSKARMILFRDPKSIEVEVAFGRLTIDDNVFHANDNIIYSDDVYILKDIKTIVPAFKCYHKLYDRSTCVYTDVEVLS